MHHFTGPLPGLVIYSLMMTFVCIKSSPRLDLSCPVLARDGCARAAPLVQDKLDTIWKCNVRQMENYEGQCISMQTKTDSI